MKDLEDLIRDLIERIDYLKDVRVGIPLEHLDYYDKAVAELKARMGQLGQPNLQNEAEKLSEGFESFIYPLFSLPTPLQIEAIARTMQRPKTLDYIRACFNDFIEIGGNEHISRDPAIVCGIAQLDGRDVMLIGHEKGRFDEYRNGGSAKPQGNRKAMDAMSTAETYNIPIITFIDTPGAYPLEEQLPAQTIAENIAKQGFLTVPHLSFVIGEGGSGGALAIDVSDRRIMAEKAYYSVISIGGAAAILGKKKEAVTEEDLNRIAENLKLTSYDALNLGIADSIMKEPFLGARICDFEYFKQVRNHLIQNLDEICLSVSTERGMDRKSGEHRWKLNNYQRHKLVRNRFFRYRNIGSYELFRNGRVFSVTSDRQAGLADWLEVLWFSMQEKITPYYNRARRRLKPIARSIMEKGATLVNLKIGKDEPEQSEETNLGSLATTRQKISYVTCPNSGIPGKHDISIDRLFRWYDGVCPTCNYHFKITIEEYIELIADRGVLTEFNEHIRSSNPLNFAGFEKKLEESRRRTGKQSAMLTGYATINGINVIMVLTDFAFRGGTLGSAEGEKYVRAVERAMRERLPVVGISQTGGVRVQEGILGLMQMVKTGLAAAELKYRNIPYISVHADPTMAGSLASYVSIATVRIAEPNAQIGFAGLDVIERTVREKLNKDYQSSENVLQRGGLDLICQRGKLKETITRFIEYHKKHTQYEFR